MYLGPGAFLSIDSGQGPPGTPSRRVAIEGWFSGEATSSIQGTFSEVAVETSWGIAADLGVAPAATVYSTTYTFESHTVFENVSFWWLPGITGFESADAIGVTVAVSFAARVTLSETPLVLEADGKVLAYFGGAQPRYSAMLVGKDVSEDLRDTCLREAGHFSSVEYRVVSSPSSAGRLLREERSRLRRRPRSLSYGFDPER